MIKRSNVEVIIAGGGVLFRCAKSEIDVLLIKRNGVWDLPKGKLEENEAIAQCAVREVAEEVGVKLPSLVSPLIETYHEYSIGDKNVGKRTYWFSMILPVTNDVTFTPQRKEGIHEVKWFKLAEAKNRVGYQNLVQVLIDFENKMKA